MTTISPVTADDARALRTQLVDAVIDRIGLRDERVVAALRAVPRHLFAPPGTPLPVAYSDDIVATKHHPDTGRVMSSLSAPWLVATMLEQLDVRPGDGVLEIGSGGYNAALLAELVGEGGEVTTMDIDGEVTDRARRCLTATGYDRVRVRCADGHDGVAADAPFDKIIVTVQAGSIPPAWVQQLTAKGRLVVPLDVRGLSRSFAFDRGAHGELVAVSAVMCGFVPMQGVGAHPERWLSLHGEQVRVRIDEPVDPAGFAGILDTPRIERWSQVTTPPATPFDDLFWWLATAHRQGFGLLNIDKNVDVGWLDAQNRVVCPTLVGDGSIAYLALRKRDDTTYEFGAYGFGAHAGRLVDSMVEQIHVWDREHRHGPGPRVTYHPTGAPGPSSPADLVVDTAHGRIALMWPRPAL